MRFHINPETGEPGRCTAVTNCRFGLASDGHHSSATDAREAYEETMRNATVPNPETLTKASKGRIIPEGTKAYHVSLSSNDDSILSGGLTPSIGERSTDLGEEKNAVYLFPSLEDMENALGNWLGEYFDEDDQLSVFEIDASGLEDTSEVEYEFVIEDGVESSRLKFLRNE